MIHSCVPTSGIENFTRKTRLAPSPTGALHLGNARSFLINWLIARQNGWSIELRIEDLDGPRIKVGADQQAMEDLTWLGIDWDRGPVYQVERLPIYRAAIEGLLAERRAYACICSRREAQLAGSAPHAEDGSTRYPGTCRDRFESVEAARIVSGREPCIRFRMPDCEVSFVDGFAHEVNFNATALGDFVIRKADGWPAYQLAVVVDDAQGNVTDIVRGNDLLESTARQILIYRAMGLERQVPQYTHLPLIIGADGRRLAKRHGDSRLSRYRSLGVPRTSIIKLLASWCGIDGLRDEATARELIGRFDLSKVPREPIIFAANDEQSLLQSTGGVSS